MDEKPRLWNDEPIEVIIIHVWELNLVLSSVDCRGVENDMSYCGNKHERTTSN